MAQQQINIGTSANSGTGDVLRTAFTKINDNFSELYARSVFSGSYNDLTNKPVIFNGDYNNLTNKPAIPVDISDLTDAQNLLNTSSYNQSLNTTDDVTFNTITITNVSGIENADGQRITNSYYNGTLLVGSNMTQTPVSILMGGAGPRNEWKFTPDGNLTLPENGDILDSNGISVLSNNVNTGDFTFNGNILSTDVGMSLSMNSGNLDINVGNKTYSFVNNTGFGFSYLEIPGSIQAGLQTGFLSSNGLGIAIDGYNSPNTVDIGNISTSTVLRLTDGDGAGKIVLQSLGSSIKLKAGNGGAWEFKDNGTVTFPNGTVQNGAAIDLTQLKALVADSTDFNDFKNRIAAL